MKNISIIVPCYKEEKNIEAFYTEISKVLKDIPNYTFDLLFVNDGSPDNTLGKIKEIISLNKIEQSIAEKEENVAHNISIKYIDFSRNFGHQAAIDAGMKNSNNADAVIMLDADLQHPPRYIKIFIEKWEEGYKIVNAKRLETEGVSLFKKITSNSFYWFFNKLSDTQIEPGTSDFRLLDKQVVQTINRLNEKKKFFRGLVSWVGFKSTNIEYAADKRKFGTSSYTLKKMLQLAHEGITSFSMKPLKVIFTIGLFLMISGGLGFSYMIIYKYLINYNLFTGPAVLAMFIILNNGILITLIGILSNYQIAMHQEIQNRPNYIIRESSENSF